MKTQYKISILVLLTAFGLLGNSQAQEGHHSGLHCTLSAKKEQSLTKEQRDEERLSCLKKKANQLSLKKCLNDAQDMEYSTIADEARLLCLDVASPTLTVGQCSLVAKSMEYEDNADDVLWECIQHFGHRLTKNQ